MVLLGLITLLYWGSRCDGVFQAEIVMAGVSGWITIDPDSEILTSNFTGVCKAADISIHEFPVPYGGTQGPCLPEVIGRSLYNLTLSNNDFQASLLGKPWLLGCSLVVRTCGLQTCANLHDTSGSLRTWRATLRSFLVGHLYFLQLPAVSKVTIITELALLEGTAVAAAHLYLADSCQTQVDQPLFIADVGSRMQFSKNRKERSLISLMSFVLLEYGGQWACAQVKILRSKEAFVNFSMWGVNGSFTFKQESPFHQTELEINLENLGGLVSCYAIHSLPISYRQQTEQNLCDDVGTGAIWNPLGVNTSDPTAHGNYHSQWEIGDLSGRHPTLQGTQNVQLALRDYNLPLYGNNSIIGRSVVLYKADGRRWICGMVQQTGDVVMAVASFRREVVGRVMFRQSLGDPEGDLSVLIELSPASGIASQGHNWHIHELALQTEADSCTKAGRHFNPHKVPTGGNYSQECGSWNPVLCEAGDFTGRHSPITFPPLSLARYLFTDTSTSLSGPTSILGKSLVIHGLEGSLSRVACANILLHRPIQGRTSSWFGSGDAKGELRAWQTSDLDPTSISFTFSGLGSHAGGYHIHDLPVIAGSANPCSNELIRGHFNPFGVNMSASPPPGHGTDDEYEVGDISGRIGSLGDKDRMAKNYNDTNFPLSGSHSILGRSLVIHYSNGSRMQCTTFLSEPAPGGERIEGRAVFMGNITGIMILSQVIYPDGGCGDTTVLVDLQAEAGVLHKNIRWYIAGEDILEDVYNPYKIPNQAGTAWLCGTRSLLHCKVGDLTEKHGVIEAGARRLVTDSNIPLSRDFTVIERDLVLKSDSLGLLRSPILPDVPITSLLFTKETPFNKSVFCEAVSMALLVPAWKVTLLQENKTSNELCFQVRFFIIGFNDHAALDKLQAQKQMGPYNILPTCQPGNIMTHQFRQELQEE
ncbi:uncharacterized protein RCH25_037970 [Pelodytes ibericus]